MHTIVDLLANTDGHAAENVMEEVVIIGAGPAGLALGAELQRRGHHPLIVDRQTAGVNTSRAAVVHARTLEALEPLGVTTRLLGDGLRVPIFRIRDRDAALAEIDFSTIPSRYAFTLMCPQNVTERHLLTRLEELGGTVERPMNAFGVQLKSESVEVDFRQGDDVRRVETKWLVGCDGAHSVVREKSGIAFEGAAYPQSFVLADVKMDWPLDRQEVSLFFSPDGLMVVAPLPGDQYRIVATLEDAPPDPPASLFENLLRRRGPNSSCSISQTIWTSRFHIHHRVSRSPRKGRVLLCGDAAHVHSPAGGQGMNTGIQDAMSLAGALDAVLRGESEAILDDWAGRRHAVAQDVVTMTDRMTRIANLNSKFGQSVRNVLIRSFGKLPALRSAMARKLAELDN